MIVTLRGKEALTDGTHVWGSDVVLLRLLTNAYTPSDAHETNADLTGELSGDGYAPHVGLTGQSRVRNSPWLEFRAQKATLAPFGAGAGTPFYVVVEDQATGILLAVTTFSSAQSPAGNPYEVRWGGVDGIGTVFRV